MSYTDVLYEVKNQIAWLTINRPDKGNTFRRQTVLELIAALNEARNDASVRVVVLTGAGDRFFCIGGEKEPNDGQLHYHNVPPVVDLYGLIDLMPVPVIAMVNGFAVGGGNVLANMCDLTVASEQATFRQGGPMMGSYDAGFGTWFRGLGGPQALAGDLVPQSQVQREEGRGPRTRQRGGASRRVACAHRGHVRGTQEARAASPGRAQGRVPRPPQRRVRHEPRHHRPPRGELLPHRRGHGDGPVLQREAGSERGEVLPVATRDPGIPLPRRGGRESRNLSARRLAGARRPSRHSRVPGRARAVFAHFDQPSSRWRPPRLVPSACRCGGLPHRRARLIR